MDAPTLLFAKYLLFGLLLLGVLAGLHYAFTLPNWVRHLDGGVFLLLMFWAVKDAYLSGYLAGTAHRPEQ